MIIPIKLDIQSDVRPISNYVIIILTAFLSLTYIFDTSKTFHHYLIIYQWNPLSIFARIFLFKSFGSLVINAIFIYFFGNAICSTVGNKFYPALYIFFGFLGITISQLFFTDIFLGNGLTLPALAGMIVVWYPQHKLHMLLFIYFHPHEFTIKVKYVVIFYVIFSLFSVFMVGFSSPVSLTITGLILGAALAYVLYKTDLIPISNPITAGKENPFGDFLQKDENASLSKEMKIAEQILKKHDQYKIENNKIETEYMIQGRKEAVPVFRIIKTDISAGLIKCFIVNDGDSILNLKVDDAHSATIIFEPADKLKSGDTGIVKFSGDLLNLNEFSFTLNYNNEFCPSQKEFKCNFANKIIQPVQSEYSIN